MRIAYLYDCVFPYKIGGIERRVWELARRLVQRGHEVHLFGMKFWEGSGTIEQERVIIHGLCPVPPLYVGGRRAIRPALLYGLRLFHPLLRGRFDLIDAQQFPFFHCFSAKICSVLKKTPLVITWHEVWGDYWYQYLGGWGFFGKSIERGSAHLTRNMVAVSPVTARDLRSLAFNHEITVIPNGIDISHINTIPPSPPSSDIIFAGRFIREKNVDLVIAAVDLIRTGIPDVRAVIVGNGPEQGKLHGLVQDLGLEKNVSFTGFLENPDALFALMKSSKVFVFPSIREGFGMAALEAMACGLPVVTVDHPQNATMDLVSADTGMIAACSAKDIALKVQETLSSAGQNKEKCRISAAAYDWERIVSLTERYYEHVY